jgi:hypothetical protein
MVYSPPRIGSGRIAAGGLDLFRLLLGIIGNDDPALRLLLESGSRPSYIAAKASNRRAFADRPWSAAPLSAVEKPQNRAEAK